jgi:hypothetical protein
MSTSGWSLPIRKSEKNREKKGKQALFAKTEIKNEKRKGEKEWEKSLLLPTRKAAWAKPQPR